MTKEELSKELLGWNPELVFAAINNIQLVLDIDAFNEHMSWNVKWNKGGYNCYREFDDFEEARDYFLERVDECGTK